MVCKITAPTLQQLWDKISRQFSATVLNGADIIPESNEHYVRSLLFAMSQEAYAYSDALASAQDPRTANCDDLVQMAARDGVFLRPAMPYTGYISITGAAGAALAQDMEFTIGGSKYKPAETVPPQMPPAGEAILQIEAEIPGADHAPSSDEGQIVNPPAGIDAKITVMGSFCGGEEAETCEQLRARYLNRLQYRPQANLAYITDTAKQYPCVTDICLANDALCLRNADTGDNDCPSQIQLYALFRGSFACGLAPDCVIDKLNDWLFGAPQGYGLGKLPFGVCGRVRYARAAMVDIRLGGMNCATPAQQAEAEAEISDYISRLCPSAPLTIDQLSAFLTQIFGLGKIKVVIDLPDGAEGVQLNRCGDAIADLDYKICLRHFTYPDIHAAPPGCYN